MACLKVSVNILPFTCKVTVSLFCDVGQHKYPIDKMQAWRKEAKEIAKEALLYELS